MRIAVVGTGYVGLVTGVCLSEFGFHVTCVDRDAHKIANLQKDKMPIFELGLERLAQANRAAGRLEYTTDLPKAVGDSDVVFIAVGTPQDELSGNANLNQFNSAAAEVAKALKGYTLVITKSTVPVGTNRKLKENLKAINPGADFDVASNPEFLREGVAITDFMASERIVAGIDSPRAEAILTRLYQPIVVNGGKLLFTSFESAELIKYSTNCMLALRVAFINEIADYCEATGANIRDVATGIGMDHRIGEKFLQPGPGYGGSCFPKDTMALQAMTGAVGQPSLIVEAAIRSNTLRKEKMVKKILNASGGSVKGKTVAILGLTFKPGTDDMREGASLVIVPALIEAGAKLRLYDPEGMKEAKHIFTSDSVTWCQDSYDAMQNADFAVILTEWNEFRSLDLAKVKTMLADRLIVDLRNIYKRRDMLQHGFHYVSIGRQDVVPGNEIPDLKLASL